MRYSLLRVSSFFRYSEDSVGMVVGLEPRRGTKNGCTGKSTAEITRNSGRAGVQRAQSQIDSSKLDEEVGAKFTNSHRRWWRHELWIRQPLVQGVGGH